MKQLSLVLLCALASLVNAELIDNFDSYSAGSELNVVSKGAWLNKGASSDQTVQDDGTGNLFYRAHSSSGSYTRGATIDLGPSYIPDGTSAVLSFRVMVLPGVTLEDVSFGLTDLPASESFDDDWGSFGPYVAFKQGNVNVRMADGTFVSTYNTTPGIWYNIRMVVDNDLDTYSVFLDGSELIADAPFRKNPSGDILSFKVLSNGNTNTQYVGVDDVTIGGYTAHTPTPTNQQPAVELDTQLSWMAPEVLNATGYDVYFGSDPNTLSPNYDMEKIVDNQLVLTADPTLHSALLSLDYSTTYYWQVDVYGADTETPEYLGDLWSFTTVRDDTAPTIVDVNSYLTWIDNMPQDVSVVVDDREEGDVVDLSWAILSGPGYATADDMQMIDRADYITNIQGDPNLLRDWIGTDSRDADEANSDVLTLTLSGLPSGNYNWLSYHYDANNQGTFFDVVVTDASGTVTTTGVAQSSGLADPNTFTTAIVSDGSDVTLAFIGSDDEFGMFAMNGFALTGDGDPLMIDFSQNRTEPELPYIMNGYQGYLADHEVVETFTTQSYSAFGTTVSITPSWDAPGAVLTSTGGTLLAPTATLSATDAPKVTGIYTIQATATDGIDQQGSATLEVRVGADACAAAKINGGTVNYFDIDSNCVVNLLDFAAFAGQWLDDIQLTETVLY